MKAFADLFDQIDQTNSTNEKVHYLKLFFEGNPSADCAWALFFLSGQKLKRLVSSKALLEWVMDVADIPAWLLEESYSSVGDIAETVSLLLPRSQAAVHSNLSLSEWMETRILPLRNLRADEQKDIVAAFWHELTRNERFILNKILTSSLRVGVSHLLTIRALSQALDVPKEAISQKLMGSWTPTAEFFDSLRTSQHTASLNPYPFYLASPLEGELEVLGDPSLWLAEWKWDGIRSQCISREGGQAIWSRGNELVSHQFPELMDSLQRVPSGTVLDGEILAYQDGRPLSFAALQKRLGRKAPSKAIQEEIPIILMVYDILEWEGKDIRDKPIQERRKLVEAWAGKDNRFLVSPRISFSSWDEIREKRLEARELLTEGIMLKKQSSAYGYGRQKGNWWKFKVDPMSIDTVLLYAQTGQGNRANLYTDYTFAVWDSDELIPIAKAYSGLTQEEITTLDKWIRRNTEEKFGPVRRVKAEQVFEIAFEGIQASNRHKSGVALRFPRIARWRKDKPIDECDTIQRIRDAFLRDDG
ncbi:MAG: ATP-dependent DNA ligase [Chlamydiales bacterium]|nr:ATP-dependent DNA ligase [Chlamydiales bacterium]